MPRKGRLASWTVAAGLLSILIYAMLWSTGHEPVLKTLARKEFAVLCAAIRAYHADMGCYPADTGFGLRPEKTPGTYDSGSLWRCLVRSCRTARGTEASYLHAWPENQLQRYDDPQHGPSYVLLDVWQSPYGFVGDSRRVIHNKGGFDLFSAGPDTVTACNNDLDDAIPGKLVADGIVDCSTDPLSRSSQDNRAYNAIDDDGNGIIDDWPEFGPEASANGCIGDDVANWDSKRTH